MRIEVGYRIDIRIDELVLVENKTVEKVLPIHLAQLLTYLKLSGLTLGLIINWNVILLRDGIQRVGANIRRSWRRGRDSTPPWPTSFFFLGVPGGSIQ